MSITLSPRDQRLLGSTMRAMLRLDAAEPLEWERGVCRRLKVLLRADRVGLFGSAAAPEATFSEDYDDAFNRAYSEYYVDRDPGRQRLIARPRPYFTRAGLFADGLEPLLDSECYNDFFVPNGVEDSTGLALPADGPGQLSPGVLAAHRGRFGSEDFVRRAPTLLRLLLEPFRQGFLMRQRLRRHLSDLHRTIDALPQPAALFRPDGRLAHANARLLEHLARSVSVREVEARIARAARACAAAHQPDAAPLAEATADPEVTATLIHSLAAEPLVLVVLADGGDGLPSVREIRTRFGLTRRQAEVARLLAERKTNEEVAEALSISPHTARRHTEAVLSALGVSSRRGVASALHRGAGPERPCRPVIEGFRPDD